jgi:hypothetical protein
MRTRSSAWHAAKEANSLESRFDLAYNAAHALPLAALRRTGYRAANRHIVFQVFPHTLGVGPEVWRVLARCHELRNRGEYEGRSVRRRAPGCYEVRDSTLSPHGRPALPVQGPADIAVEFATRERFPPAHGTPCSAPIQSCLASKRGATLGRREHET